MTDRTKKSPIDSDAHAAPADPQPTDPNHLDNPFAPETFAADACGFFLSRNGLVTITLTAPRIDHRQSPGPLRRVVVGRLTMPAQSAMDFALGLYDFLQTHADVLKQHGIELGPAPDQPVQ
jgi:hypothetical protein